MELMYGVMRAEAAVSRAIMTPSLQVALKVGAFLLSAPTQLVTC